MARRGPVAAVVVLALWPLLGCEPADQSGTGTATTPPAVATPAATTTPTPDGSPAAGAVLDVAPPAVPDASNIAPLTGCSLQEVCQPGPGAAPPEVTTDQPATNEPATEEPATDEPATEGRPDGEPTDDS